HTFCRQLPQTCDGAGPGVYVTPHFPPVHIAAPNDAHGPGGTGGHALASSSLHSASSPPSAPLPAVPVKPPVPSRPPVPPGFAAAQKSRSIVAHDATASNASTPAVRRATTPRLYHRRCAAAAVEQRRALVRSP